jgi:pimeloyl-ACP methyl ester carboxylesterase
MPKVRVGSLDLGYEETGSGDPVLLVNGTGESGQTWLAQVAALAVRYRCVAIDNRDTGQSSYVNEPYTPREMAEDLAGLIDGLGLGPTHVVGYSLGGAAAQELAIGRPELVRSLVLLSTWARSDEWFKAEMRNWAALRTLYWDDEAAFLDALLPWIFSPASYATPGLIEGYVTLGQMREPLQRPEGFMRQLDADMAHDAEDRLGRVRAPTLIIVGEDDLCTPPRYARGLAELIPGSALVTVPSAAHGALWERPDDVNGAILGFLGMH